MVNKNKGITLVALVVTIVVLLILAGITINYVISDNGIFAKAQEAKQRTEEAQIKEQIGMDLFALEASKGVQDSAITQADIEGVLTKYGTINKNKDGTIKSLTPTGKKYEIALEELWSGTLVPSYNEDKKVNSPQILAGMTPIKFEMPTDSKKGEAVVTDANDDSWYEYGETYETRKWANAKTQDGSMWVWIPRFAYKITGQTIDVVFLIGNTDEYYKADGTTGTAKRMKSANEVPDTTTDYTVHPAFTNETSIGYSNGGWDKELTGIWVAKFEAGFPTGNNTAPNKKTSVSYTNNQNGQVYIQATESGSSDKWDTARNWLDGIYGTTDTKISYPVFQGSTYAMNYISIGDAYNVSRTLTSGGNIYGLSSSTDSHLMKNSEWGAVTYLSQSKYGQNGKEITINNANLLSGGTSTTKANGNKVASVYAVTGCTSNTTDGASTKTTIEAINGTSGNTATTEGIYTWNQKSGQNASTTGTIYGIYDMSGGTWERTSSYVANNHENLKIFGESVAYQGTNLKTTSTKYTTVYPHNEAGETNIDTLSQKNFANNTKIYGDAVRETTSGTAGTSASGWNTSAWNADYSGFPALGDPFFARGGSVWNGSHAGSFAFSRTNGYPHYNDGFRAVLVGSSAL